MTHESIASPVSVPERGARKIADEIIDKAAARTAVGTPLGKIEWINGLSDEIAAALQEMREQYLVALGALSDDDRTSTWNLAIREAVKTVAALDSLPSPVSVPEGDARALIDDIIRDICELPDRTSPEDRPDNVMMSVAELHAILKRHCPAALLSAESRGERKGAGFRFDTPSLRARGVGRVGDEPRALLVLLTDIPGDDDIRALHDWLVHRPAWRDASLSSPEEG